MLISWAWLLEDILSWHYAFLSDGKDSCLSLSFRNEIMLLGEKIKSNFKTAVDEEFYDKIYAIASYIF